MGEASWRKWCWWRACLVVMVVAAAAAAVQQGSCEVLDSSLQSTFTLSTNLTLLPLRRQWWLDFALQQTHSSSTACVRVELNRKLSNVRLRLFRGTCSGGRMLDYDFIKGVVLVPTAWTLLKVNVIGSTVVVEPSGAPTVVLQAGDGPLPQDTLQVVEKQGVEAAVGCRVNCPHYKHSSRPGKKKNVLTTPQEDVLFYFRPGENFTKLQHEVGCTTTLGSTFYPHVADIIPSPGRWHVVEMQHRGGVAQIILDYEQQQSRDLPPQCAFEEHTVRIEGQGLFTFSCNPASGVPEWEGIDSLVLFSGDACSVKDHAITASVAMAVTIVLAVGICLVLYSCVVKRFRKRAMLKVKSYIREGDTCPFCNQKKRMADW